MWQGLDLESGYGLGWGVREAADRPPEGSAWGNWRPQIVSHTGGMAGVTTVLMILPEYDIAVVALCNAASPLPIAVGALLLFPFVVIFMHCTHVRGEVRQTLLTRHLVYL